MSVVIIGGGPAGAAAACVLARAGQDVTVLERDIAPTHKVCGDFLSAEAQRSLAELGIDPATLAGAPIRAVRIASDGRTAISRLPFSGLGVTRRTLDAALLARAQALGAEVRRGVTVRHLGRDGGRVIIHTDHGALTPETAFLGTGKHALRGAARPARASDLVGLKMYLRLAPAQAVALARHVEIIPFATGYAGLNTVEDGAANLCLLVGRRRLTDAGGWDGLLAALSAECPLLAERLSGAAPLLAKPLAVSGLAYGYLHAPDATDPMFRLGDQAAVIGSFSGDGVSIALHTGRLAAATLLAGGDAAAYHRQLRADLTRQMRVARIVHRAFLLPLAPAVIVAAGRAAPSLLRLGAALTRIPIRAEQRVHAPGLSATPVWR